MNEMPPIPEHLYRWVARNAKDYDQSKDEYLIPDCMSFIAMMIKPMYIRPQDEPIIKSILTYSGNPRKEMDRVISMLQKFYFTRHGLNDIVEYMKKVKFKIKYKK